MRGYKVGLYVKGEEQRFLGICEETFAAGRTAVSLLWLPENLSHDFEWSREDALLLIEQILNASMPSSSHDLNPWSILKIQACVSDIEDDGWGWTVKDNSSFTYIELYRVKDGHKEAQWKLDLAVSQQEEISAIRARDGC